MCYLYLNIIISLCYIHNVILLLYYIIIMMCYMYIVHTVVWFLSVDPFVTVRGVNTGDCSRYSLDYVVRSAYVWLYEWRWQLCVWCMPVLYMRMGREVFFLFMIVFFVTSVHFYIIFFVIYCTVFGCKNCGSLGVLSDIAKETTVVAFHLFRIR